MGGQAFEQPGPNGEPALVTPRMPPDIYFPLRSRYAEILRTLYTKVAIPIEGPGKASFGDIDFLVCGPRDGAFPSGTSCRAMGCTQTTALSAAFGATRVKNESPVSASFAVPLHLATTAANADDDAGVQSTDDADAKPCHAQVDVYVCPEHLFDWTRFHKSYGDLWQILGLMLRAHGLRPTHEGLFVRVAEMEAASSSWRKRAQSCLFLTADPLVTMAFLGLDAAAYYAGFHCEREVFEWVAGSRFFSRAAFERHRETNHSDRQRVKKRAMFKRFLDEWLTSLPASVTDENEQQQGEPIDKDATFQKALEYFHVEGEYHRMIEDFRAQQKEIAFWKAVVSVLPLEGDHLNLAIRGLKRWVIIESAGPDTTLAMPVVSETPEMDSEKQPVWTADDRRTNELLLTWVRENWEEVKAKERSRVKQEESIRKQERRLRWETATGAEASLPNNADRSASVVGE